MLLPLSGTPGVVFPALPPPAAALALAIQAQLDETQWLPVAELRRLQLAQLDLLLRHAHATSPGWRARLEAAGYRPDRPLAEDTFARLSVLRREDLQREEEALRCAQVPQAHGTLTTAATSGSTGRPVRVQKTGLCDLFWQALTLREHRWHHRDLSGKLAVIRHFKQPGVEPPAGHRLDVWGPSTNVAYRTGPSSLLTIWADPRAQAKWLRRENPDYLLTYPSNLRALARLFERRQKRLPKLREIRTVSEMLTPDVKAYAERVFGVPITDVYSSQEVGYVAAQCDQHRYHVQSEACRVEVLDDAGRPCGPGEVGRVVVTPLHNFAQPLLRYDLGDLAEVGEPCSCGRGLPVLARVLGRVRNLLVYPDGHRAWPLFRDDRFAEIAPVRQYQLVQKTLEHLELRLVADRPLTGSEEDALRAILVDRLRHPFRITFAYPSEIPRSAGGKYEDFRSEVDP